MKPIFFLLTILAFVAPLIAQTPLENTLFVCSDGIDNDGDGLIDLDDPNCKIFLREDSDKDGILDDCDNCITKNQEDDDDDGIENGCDTCEGFDDLEDSDKDGVPDGCDNCLGHDDTIDTDGNGIPDGCEGENTLLKCTDGIDNDGNGLIDCDDGGCQRLLKSLSTEEDKILDRKRILG